MKWQMECAGKLSGADVTVLVDAPDDPAACRIAEAMGFVVASCVPAPAPLPKPVILPPIQPQPEGKWVAYYPNIPPQPRPAAKSGGSALGGILAVTGSICVALGLFARLGGANAGECTLLILGGVVGLILAAILSAVSAKATG